MKEEDLFDPIKDFFVSQGFKVDGEVKSCDVTALKEDLLIVIELKKNLTVTLLSQAVKRQKISDLVYVAVPKPLKFSLKGKWSDVLNLLKRLELGLIFVDFKKTKPVVDIILEPVFFDREKSIRGSKRKRESLLNEIKARHTDITKGGTTRQKIMTSFREESLYIACCFDLYGELSTKQLKVLGCNQKRTYNIIYQNYYGWFINIEKGIYGLNNLGKQALSEYPELVSEMKDKIFMLGENE